MGSGRFALAATRRGGCSPAIFPNKAPPPPPPPRPLCSGGVRLGGPGGGAVCPRRWGKTPPPAPPPPRRRQPSPYARWRRRPWPAVSSPVPRRPPARRCAAVYFHRDGYIRIGADIRQCARRERALMRRRHEQDLGAVG